MKNVKMNAFLFPTVLSILWCTFQISLKNGFQFFHTFIIDANYILLTDNQPLTSSPLESEILVIKKIKYILLYFILDFAILLIFRIKRQSGLNDRQFGGRKCNTKKLLQLTYCKEL